MPWFPEFTSAVELARLEFRPSGQADPVAQYLRALSTGDVHALEDVWPGEVVIEDPKAGEIRGHHQLRHFVRENQAWLNERRARIETIASTVVAGRAVVELLAHLSGDHGDVRWPIAVVAESSDDRSVVFRTYCSQWPVDGRRHVRPQILGPGAATADGIVGRYQAALGRGDVDGAVGTFAATAYYRESIGPDSTHLGTDDLRAFFSRCFSAGGGIKLEECTLTDDGVRCAMEYNLLRWGRHPLSPQAGIAVCERGADGLLAAVRVYDDVEAPADLR